MWRSVVPGNNRKEDSCWCNWNDWFRFQRWIFGAIFNANVGLKKSIDVVETMKQNELIEVVTSGHCIFILVPLFLCFSCVTRSCVANIRVFQDIHPMTSAEKPPDDLPDAVA